MALPASGPISGSQIATELDVGATNLSLSGMIASSSISDTNPDQYSEFYGYTSRVFVSRYGSTVSKPAFACENDYGYAVQVWFVKTSIGQEFIEVGNYCYTSQTGDTVLANGNYAIGFGISSQPFYIITIANGTGYVSAVYECGEGF
jgi:hypothetical protein